MHCISKLILWLSGLTLSFLSFNIGLLAAFFYMQGLMEKRGMRFDEPLFQETLPMLAVANFLLAIINAAFVVYVIHGKPSQDSKYVPKLTLCGTVVSAICCIALRFYAP